MIRASPRLKDADVSLEVWGAQRKSDVLARMLGCDVVIEPDWPQRPAKRASHRLATSPCRRFLPGLLIPGFLPQRDLLAD